MKRIDDLENTQLRNELQNQALEKALLATENAYLKSQINPHFLLNTLNFLYNSVSKLSEKIADSVMTLSDIMRYALTNADEDGKVKLESEIEHISNFIKLNQARFNQRLCIELLMEGDPEGLRIIPLVLITLAENVFKYGDLLSESYPAKINIIIHYCPIKIADCKNKRFLIW
jgi:LytS/YehU family sensor histidine kinase